MFPYQKNSDNLSLHVPLLRSLLSEQQSETHLRVYTRINIKTVLLHNLAAHNVNVTGRVCYLT